MRTYFLILVLGLSFSLNARENPYNSTEWWSRLKLEEQFNAEKLTQIDTCIIVVTNRGFTNDKLRFMSEHVHDGTLQHFFVYSFNNKWHCLKVNSLDSAINLIPNKNKDWVIYTEGMGKIFPSEVYRGMMMASQYNVNVIMLDYPSITTTKSMIGNYFFALKNAKGAYKYHLRTLEEIMLSKQNGDLGSNSLNLFFHSMGNNLIMQIAQKRLLHQLNKGQWVNNIILNAACVPQRKHAEWISNIQFSKRVYILHNPEDRVLRGASLISKKTQLGNTPKAPLVSGVIYTNFNSLVSNGHSYFLNIEGREEIPKEAYEYYNRILHEEHPELTVR